MAVFQIKHRRQMFDFSDDFGANRQSSSVPLFGEKPISFAFPEYWDKNDFKAMFSHANMGEHMPDLAHSFVLCYLSWEKYGSTEYVCMSVCTCIHIPIFFRALVCLTANTSIALLSPATLFQGKLHNLFCFLITCSGISRTSPDLSPGPLFKNKQERILICTWFWHSGK